MIRLEIRTQHEKLPQGTCPEQLFSASGRSSSQQAVRPRGGLEGNLIFRRSAQSADPGVPRATLQVLRVPWASPGLPGHPLASPALPGLPGEPRGIHKRQTNGCLLRTNHWLLASNQPIAACFEPNTVLAACFEQTKSCLLRTNQ